MEPSNLEIEAQVYTGRSLVFRVSDELLYSNCISAYDATAGL